MQLHEHLQQNHIQSNGYCLSIASVVSTCNLSSIGGEGGGGVPSSLLLDSSKTTSYQAVGELAMALGGSESNLNTSLDLFLSDDGDLCKEIIA